ARGAVEGDAVVEAAVAVADDGARVDHERAAVEAEHVLGGVALAGAHRVARLEAALGRRGRARGGAVIDLARAGREQVEGGGRDRARGAVEGDAVVEAAV